MSQVLHYFDEINNNERFFIEKITELPGNGLEIQIVLPNVGEERDIPVTYTKTLRGRPVTYDGQSPRFLITFEKYIGYAVLNESFDNGDPTTCVEGRYLRICEHSAFLDYIGKDTFATADFPGPFRHFQLLGQDQLVNVACEKEPLIERIR